MAETSELGKVYDPASVEGPIYQRWLQAKCFASKPDGRPPAERYTIVIPPPNVTGALHLGHALNNTLQDILIRWHRMMGQNTLWLPGTDHAGIATQAVVERRLLAEEGKTRHEIGREELVKRIWQWKDQYEKRILSQLQLIGCSCDWDRTRFTLDDGLARAVRHTFFKFFKDGLIFRGKRLVNWDTQLQTAVSDDEVEHETVKGHFWHFKYKVIDPKPGEPTHVQFATTRPETMLGDVAVAVHPDPAAAIDKREGELKERLAKVPAREKPDIQAQLERLTQRRTTHLPRLIQLRDMANDNRRVCMPLLGGDGKSGIPLVTDEWADPLLGSGCVKITPAHDFNDYEVGQRCDLPTINIMAADGTVNSNGGKYTGLTMTEARKQVTADMEAMGLLDEIEDKDIDLAHSQRSKTPIEPFLSDQWFLKMGDLAQAAMDAVTDGRIKFFPQRYAKSYLDWLGEKRDWCISRQLWWGHQIPVWSRSMMASELCGDRINMDIHLAGLFDITWCDAVITVEELDGSRRWHDLDGQLNVPNPGPNMWRVLEDDVHKTGDFLVRVSICCNADFPNDKFPNQPGIERLERYAVDAGFEQDPDVLDTWFSSALWPYSTLGWPDETDDLKYYYPGSVLVTSRDIITNWVARMVLTGLYNMGEIPFDHVYIHTKILDGRGETMSKSKGNGVDPIDVVHIYGADAMRYCMAEMATETQDVRMPVDYVCPHCEHLVPQAQVVPHNKQPADVSKVTCKSCKKTFATLWADPKLKNELPVARETSEKFEIGRNFCNKLYNSVRFACMNLENTPCEPLRVADLPPEDRWILARLSQTIRAAHQAIEQYHFSPAMKGLRDFYWDSLCDWYIELTKPRLRDEQAAPVARQVLAFVLDQMLRLLSPFVPFITERLWEELNHLAPKRGLPGAVDLESSEILMLAKLPPADGYPALDDDEILAMFDDVQQAVRGVRDLRNKCKISPKETVSVIIKSTQEHLDRIAAQQHVIESMAGVGNLSLSTDAQRPANAGTTVVGPLQIFVPGISDDAAERKRLEKELASVEKRLGGARSKLSNEKFLAGAKPEVIESERARLGELEKSLHAIQNSLADLAG